MSLNPGTRFGPYEVESQLGKGGMGEVYRARDVRLGRRVALKVLTGTVARDPRFGDRFDREARAISALTHPNICTLYDIGREDGTPFLVMELLDGDTLAARLARGSLPHAEVLSIATQMGDALDAAHRAGIIHRDLKPGNIMLSRVAAGSAGSPQAKLLDFGLAKPVSRTDATETTEAALTSHGDVLGTLPYMAPEQLEGRQVDARADIWAFGCVLYEMVSGRRAFTAESDARLISAILTTEPPALTSSPLDRLIRKCLAKDPDRRWQTAADLTDELRWIDGRSGEHVSPVAAVAEQRRVPRWRRLLMMAAAGLALTAAGIAGYYLRPLPEVRPTRFEFPPPLGTAWGEGLAISPDGRRVAFSAASDGRSSIWILDLNNTSPRKIGGTEDAVQPFWSPDGVSIGFFAGGKLKTVPADGGPVQELADAARPGGGTWNRDNVIVFSADVNIGLQRVLAHGGPAANLTTLDVGAGEVVHRAPVFLPDGRHLFYAADAGGVFATSLDEPGHRGRVLDTPTTVQFVLNHLLFVRTGSLYAQPFDLKTMALSGEATRILDRVSRVSGLTSLFGFSASETGELVYRTGGAQPVRQFVWVDRYGRELSRVPVTGALGAHDVSEDGRRLAFAMTSSGNRDIYVLDLTVEHPVPRKRTFDSRAEGTPVLSTDGRRIAFSRDDGRAGLFEIDADGEGSERELLPPDKGFTYAHGYTKDGQTLLVSRFPPPGHAFGGLFTLSLEGKPRLVEFLDSPESESVPRLSPDNHWLAYRSNAGNRSEIYVERFPSLGGKALVSNGTKSAAHWRDDGLELFYVGLDNQLMAVPMKDGGLPGPAIRLFDAGVRTDFAVGKGGQRFLVNWPATGSDANTTEVVMNWPALLKR